MNVYAYIPMLQVLSGVGPKCTLILGLPHLSPLLLQELEGYVLYTELSSLRDIWIYAVCMRLQAGGSWCTGRCIVL